MNVDSDLPGIANLMRKHIAIRNRSFMKRVYRDCFIGSDAVDFLITQGFADNRKVATEIGQRMLMLSIIHHVTKKSTKRFQDAYIYFRFADDDVESACLAPSNAGNGNGTYLGLGGCKFSFCPHTVHNSYIMDIALAEEVERAVAGASIESRAHAIGKLRARVREQAEPDAPDWALVQTTQVNQTNISIFQRKRPRGDFNNVKMTGVVGDSPKGFIRGIMSFDKRKQWESMFEDGFVVEAIDIGEKLSPILQDEEENDTGKTTTAAGAATAATATGGVSSPAAKIPVKRPISPNGKASRAAPAPATPAAPATPVIAPVFGSIGAAVLASPPQTPLLPENSSPPRNLARTTDDVLTFLQTVDLAGIPAGMPIAFLNDPERQHALSHLRKQMMLSNPQECMLCQHFFETSGEIRFCPCCAMVSCGSCVSKRVFEVVARQIVSVCIHCYRSSSRIRHPPQVVVDPTNVDESIRGKWWRPEELGMIDYSQSYTESSGTSGSSFLNGAMSGTTIESSGSHAPILSAGLSLEDLESDEISPSISPTASGSKSGTKSDASGASKSVTALSKKLAERGVLYDEDEGDDDEEDVGDGVGLGVNEAEFFLESGRASDLGSKPSRQGSPSRVKGVTAVSSAPVPTAQIASSSQSSVQQPASAVAAAAAVAPPPPANFAATSRTARCKSCGAMISRDIEAIEQHMSECPGVGGDNRSVSVAPRAGSTLAFDGNNLVTQHVPISVAASRKNATTSMLPAELKSELDKSSTRIIYRTARNTAHKAHAPREVCALQDTFVDPVDGTCYLYEVSVRHSDIRGMRGYVTADVLLLMYVARPLPGGNNCSITIISQVDTRVKGSQWLLSFILDDSSSISGIGNDIGLLRREDLIRELKACGNLPNILNSSPAGGNQNGGANASGHDNDNIDDIKVSLVDFDLLAVLGRGGFGKVMQVRHRPSGEVYAMKILKKSELRRRRQVERTHTERTILAAVRHPFIVCLHYAFQNSQKLYMVMDFVQGGDFFTLMRKFRRLPEDWVRLYVCQIALALQHLHDMDVVYRDLKPENILLDGEGNIKLTDFGLSRYFETRPPATEDIIGEDRDVITRSFCGTEQYMSPEMLLQQGHNYRMDWWCLGLLMHEMISARHPFQGPSHYDTLRNMVTKVPNIDSRLSVSSALVVKGFLCKNPKERLCCTDGINELKQPNNRIVGFFQSIDWEALYNRQIEMPHKPQLNGTLDLSSFETTFTREAAVDSVTDGADDNSPTGGKNQNQQQQKKQQGRGIMNFFGMGGNNNNGGGNGNGNNGNSANAAGEPDVFKGFSFAKDESIDEQGALDAELSGSQSALSVAAAVAAVADVE